MRFWDSSALVPLLVEESSSDAMARAYREDRNVVVAWTTPMECVSACARKHRSSEISQRELMAIVERLHDLRADWITAEPSPEIASEAQRLVLRHGLRAADAIQLASAMAASVTQRPELVSLDRRLGQAAMIEGFRMIPASE